MRVCSSWKSQQGEIYSCRGSMARREITEAEQQRLDRYKQRRDEYIRQLADLAPPLSEEQKAKLVVRCVRQAPMTHAAPAPPHRGPGSGR